MRNAGFLFYKEYFKQLVFENGKPKTNFKNNDLYNLKLDYNESEIHFGIDHFELTTIYPGLLIGSGYNHEIGNQENELKLGFFFDYTTGLPCIPGSSVKGVLRDACEKAEGEYAKSIIRELVEGIRKSILTDEEKKLLDEKLIKVFEGGKNSPFVKMIFVGKDALDDYIPFSKRDIFFDAFPTNSQNENGKFLANDYITPHDNPLKNPVPIQFMKVLPQVTFKFNFRLSDEPISKKIKLELIKQILLDLGVGAKTNVGYGQFIDNINLSQSNNPENNRNNVHNSALVPIHRIPEGVKLKKDDRLDAIFTGLSGNYACFSFSKDEKDCSVSKKTQNVYEKLRKKGYEGELKKGDQVIIKIQTDHLSEKSEISFQVLMP
ncbi:MAG: type III-B CRISPR module RAMP protein Cmr6 [Ignavibacteria bacterium]|jgi:CRISPR-associated protein Cmr6|nr:type III-B CRISPR module RAMP protein Cmr6 [Ignavibacteria bacterium]